MKFFSKIFSKPKDKKLSTQNDSVEDEKNDRIVKKGIIQKQTLQSEKEEMEEMSQKQKLRKFKVENKANVYLQQSIISKNAAILNDYQQLTEKNNKKIHFREKESNDISYNRDDYNTYFQMESENPYILNNVFQHQNDSFQETIKPQTNFDLESQQLNNKVVSFKQDTLKQQQTINSNIDKSNGVRFQSHQFINESEIFENSYLKQNTQHYSKKETLQNDYLQSVFISEEDEEYEESQMSEEEKKVINIAVKDKDDTQDISDEKMDLEFLKTQEKFNSLSLKKESKVRFLDEEALRDKDKQEEKQQDEAKKIKVYRKRKRDELSAVPEEMSSFQLTFQRGKKKQLNNGDGQDLRISLMPQSTILERKSTLKNNLDYTDSKSNLNNLIQISNKNKSKLSLYNNCSDIYNFSEMTSIISQFQYQKQETKIHHQQEDFRYITNIGHGSFGSVDLYEFIPLKFPIAVKSLRKLEEFARELYLMETLQSIYMPQLFYYEETEMKLFMELGLCTLEDLKKYYISTDQVITDDQAFAILNQLIVAIEILIDQKAFHSDIKPSNIVIRSKLNEKKEINLQIMMIDFGGASFDIEDYWIYYTPAFVCIPLWDKMLKSDSQNENKEQIQISELDSVNEHQGSQFQKSSLSMIQKVESNIVNPIYQPSLKKNNLRELDKQNSVQVLGSNNSSSTTQSNTPNHHSTMGTSLNRNLFTQTMSLKQQQTPNKIETQGSQKFGNERSFQQAAHQSNSQFRQSYSKQVSQESIMDTRKKKLEQLQQMQRDIETRQQEWQKTQNLTLDRNNEKYASECLLTWEEIRFSEVYAGCRCIQYLILRKDDSEELFKKKNIDEFMIKYHKEYPKTLKLIYKVFRNENFKMNSSILNSLFSKTTDEDYKLKFDPNLIFNISPLKKQLQLIKDKSY